MQKINVFISPAHDETDEPFATSSLEVEEILHEDNLGGLPVPCRGRRRSSVIEYHNTFANLTPMSSSPAPSLSSVVDDEGFVDVDEEWCTPVTKILKLPYDHESWQHAQEILDAPSPLSRKVGDEARSIAARHIIDRLKEEHLLSLVHKVAPRLRSAVELLSKPDGDYVYPTFQFVVNELRHKYPEVYTSVIQNVCLQIPSDIKPSTMLVSLAKSTVENMEGELEMNWGKFASLLGLSGALAIDSVKAGYPDGVAEVVETFGLIVEQVLGEWILSEGGWDGFIRMNVYQATLPPVPRTIIILSMISIFLLFISRLFVTIFYAVFPTVPEELDFWGKWYSLYPTAYCMPLTATGDSCENPRTPLDYLFQFHMNYEVFSDT